jgi:PAS domain S-box-containing protein
MTFAPTATNNDALIGELFLRLDHLEQEIRQLKAQANPPSRIESLKTESFESAAFEGYFDPESVTETKSLRSLQSDTPPTIGWPAKKPAFSRDTPLPDVANPEFDLLRVACDMNLDAVVAVDSQGRVQVWNTAATQLFGWSREDCLGMAPPFLPADKHEEHASLIRYPRSILPDQEVTTERLTHTGERVAVRLRVSESRCGGVVFCLREAPKSADHTPDPRPAMETPAPRKNTITAHEPTAVAMATVGRAAVGAAHDFNNMLTVIQGFGELIREQLPTDSDTRDMAATIVRTAEMGGIICKHLMSLTRPEIGTPPQTDVNLMIRQNQRFLKSVVSVKVLLEVQLIDPLPTCQIHPSELFQVLLNLTTNAADAMKPHGGRMKITTGREIVLTGQSDWPSHLAPGGYVVLTITDSGPGIDPMLLGTMFRPGATSRPATNHGLGLATIQNILEKVSGHMALETDPAWGTSFRVYFREA